MIVISADKSIVRPSENFHITVSIHQEEKNHTSCIPIQISILNGTVLIADTLTETSNESTGIAIETQAGNDVVLTVRAGTTGNLGITAISDSEVAGMMVTVL